MSSSPSMLQLSDDPLCLGTNRCVILNTPLACNKTILTINHDKKKLFLDYTNGLYERVWNTSGLLGKFEVEVEECLYVQIK